MEHLHVLVSTQGTQAESQGVLTEESEMDAEVHEQVAKLTSVEGTMAVRYHEGSKGEVEETSNDKAETEGNEENQKEKEKRPVYRNSKKDLTPGRDKASVSVSGGIRPNKKKEMEEVSLRLFQHYPDDDELKVCFHNKKEVARVEFYSIINAGSAPPLCRLHLRTPTQGTERSDFWELRQPSAVKEGSPTNDELEHLSTKISNSWRTLGRRLSFHEAQLKEFDNGHEQISEKAYAMLSAWKQRYGSDATYIVLSQALCHTLVNRRDLAEEFCCY